MKLRLRRIGADLVDLALCFAKAFVLSAIPAFFASGMKIGASTVLAVCAVMAYAFFIIKDIRGKSFGKKLFSLRIVGWDGKQTGIFQRVRRNLTLILFPVEFILVIAGYDTVGDNLGMTCVVDAKSNDVPGMKKGNNLARLICLTVLMGAVSIAVLYFSVSYLMVTGSAGYKTVKEYMQSSAIVSEYGEDIIWKVESYDKVDKDKYVYTVTVNGDTFDVTTVRMDEEWLVYGVQSETVEKLEALISDISDEDTERYAIADIDADGIPELLEYFSDDEGAHISLYMLDSAEPRLTFDTRSHAGNSRGDWRVYKDTDSRYSYALVGIYSTYTDELCEKHVYSAVKEKDEFAGTPTFFEQVVSTENIVNTDGEDTVEITYLGTYRYKDIEMPPDDYYYNYHAYFEKYVPVTDILQFEKWDAPEPGQDTALALAIKLVKKGWDHFELEAE